MTHHTLQGQIIDLHQQRIYGGTLIFSEQGISAIKEDASIKDGPYILPGFIDAHVHIESSMLVPTEFARLAVPHGTVATVSDPHEIANVLGVPGVQYMIDNARQTPFKFFFGAPSCVPATPFETAGASIGPAGVKQLLQMPEVPYLAEMMNWPGVLNKQADVLEKIKIAHDLGKPVDGHAPGLKGQQAKNYIAAGISTDHECFTTQEALDKLRYGMKVIIREGSAARNFDALAPLLHEHYENIMFCSDDKHPDNLVQGHINQLVQRALALGVDLFKVLQVACVNPVQHYKLPVGLLRVGDPADFMVVQDLEGWQVQATYINGQQVAKQGQTLLPHQTPQVVNNFTAYQVQAKDFAIAAKGQKLRVITCQSGQLVTGQEVVQPKVKDGLAVANVANDVLKLSVVNRYKQAAPAVAFIKGFGLQAGALASSVGHDSHNITAVGVNDEHMALAVNALMEHQGGISVVSANGQVQVLPLPIAGLMSKDDGYKVATDYTKLDALAKQLGSTLEAPFMTLSFMALLVIPELKLSDKGLFNGLDFEFVDLFV